MKATFIALKPPKAIENQTSGVEPEVLAACLARYSRSNDGIEYILEKFGTKSPEAIFKFVDYGHASIGGLTGGVAIAIDGVSILSALKLFELSAMADGQESSSRYITLANNKDNILSFHETGLAKNTENLYNTCINQALELYTKTTEALERQVAENPSIARIPLGTPEKTKQRMLKNYALDRTRYFLPASTKTNLALVMSARMWAETLRGLESLPWLEAKNLAQAIRKELEKVAPNLIRHSFPDAASLAQTELLTTTWLQQTKKITSKTPYNLAMCQNSLTYLQAWKPTQPPWESECQKMVENCFKAKTNRYSTVGPWLKRITVACQWSSMALAEIRDLNRHRTGFRLTHFSPNGFYLPTETIDAIKEKNLISIYEKFCENYSNLLTACVDQDNLAYPYCLFLGTQLPFEHTQQGDKFVYEIELRTGLGAHFRYAEHLKEAGESLFKQIPELKPYVHIGTAEPE